MDSLWEQDACGAWHAALDGYAAAVQAYGTARLVELDHWRNHELAGIMASREPRFVTVQELVWVTEWKMLRGVWRARNLQLVKGNPEAEVQRISAEALSLVPDVRRPVALLMKLAGVGPATASSVLAIAAPDVYPFFDEVVAGQMPGMPAVDFTAAYYQKYAAALRERAERLSAACSHGGWPVHALDLALWSAVGGKKPRKG